MSKKLERGRGIYGSSGRSIEEKLKYPKENKKFWIRSKEISGPKKKRKEEIERKSRKVERKRDKRKEKEKEKKGKFFV